MMKKMWGFLATILPWSVHAGGFSLYTEGSAAEVGVFAAGAAAEAIDASIGWYNPAGLILLNSDQVVVSGVGVMPSTTISGTSTYYNTMDIPPYVQSFTNLTGGKQAVVPALHYAHLLGPRAVFGLSLVAPFGLATDWNENSAVRYSATLTKMTTATLAPEMGALVTDHLSIGAGLDLQWAQVKFDGVAGSPAALQYLQAYSSTITPTMYDSSSVNQGHSIGVGFHAGVLGLFNDRHTRVGVNYQSSVNHDFRGYSLLTGTLADPELTDPTAMFLSDALRSSTTLPSITTLSVYQDLCSRWSLLGSVVYTAWSVFENTELFNVAGYSGEQGTQTLLTLNTPQQFRDTWRFAGGVNYHVTDQWLLRLGGGYDETPTVNATRNVRLPDVNRWALTGGVHYDATKSLSFDLGYAYLFGIGEANINNTQVFEVDPLSSVNMVAQAFNHAQLAALQAVWHFN